MPGPKSQQAETLACYRRHRGGDMPTKESEFFFQAEDGIRDSSVTGVQTCALPISLEDGGAKRSEVGIVPQSEKGIGLTCFGWRRAAPDEIKRGARRELRRLEPRLGESVAGTEQRENRSEERRVGKEWRSRWSPDH